MVSINVITVCVCVYSCLDIQSCLTLCYPMDQKNFPQSWKKKKSITHLDLFVYSLPEIWIFGNFQMTDSDVDFWFFQSEHMRLPFKFEG